MIKNIIKILFIISILFSCSDAGDDNSLDSPVIEILLE